MSDFPPATQSLLNTIPSYLYQQYSDDDDLQGFVTAQNTLQQNYADTFNHLNLPIYPQSQISGALLDWVGQGLYGFARPYLSSGVFHIKGTYNTAMFNDWPFGKFQNQYPSGTFQASDDIYKRCLTWHIFKGDGKYFNTQWLKRRVWRFIVGTNGTAPAIDQTYRVSVTQGANKDVTIRLVLGKRTVTGGALFNRLGFNSFHPYNTLTSSYVAYPALPSAAATLRDAVNCGAVELPFQFKFRVVIN